MSVFRAAHSGAATPAAAVDACLAGLRAAGPIARPQEALGFLYASDAFAGELGRMLASLRESTGVVHWVGSLGMGVIATGKEYFDEPALAVMIAELPAGSFRVFPTIERSLDRFRAEARGWINERQPTLALVHGDSSNERLPALLEALTAEASGFLVGGLTSSRGPQSQVADEVTEGGVSGVLFSSEIAVATGLSQGCRPIGPSHVISACRDNLLIELDGRPALEVFKEDLRSALVEGEAPSAGAFHAALPIPESDTGDYLVRNLMGADPARGWLAIGAMAEEGGKIMFCRRDGKSAKRDLEEMLARLKARVGERPKGAVYYSCVARGPNLFGPESAELGLLREVLGEVPLVGFFCNGEISNARLYGYTGVLALFL